MITVAGAGMAGLVTAARLRQLGRDARLLEKGTRAGGSMLLSSCVIWRHLEWERFRAECPGGDEPLREGDLRAAEVVTRDAERELVDLEALLELVQLLARGLVAVVRALRARVERAQLDEHLLRLRPFRADRRVGARGRHADGRRHCSHHENRRYTRHEPVHGLPTMVCGSRTGRHGDVTSS